MFGTHLALDRLSAARGVEVVVDVEQPSKSTAPTAIVTTGVAIVQSLLRNAHTKEREMLRGEGSAERAVVASF